MFLTLFRLKNLPYSFTKLSQMTAMWLSENQVKTPRISPLIQDKFFFFRLIESVIVFLLQSKPLIPLQKEEEPETQKTVLTNYMFPQQTRTEDCECRG